MEGGGSVLDKLFVEIGFRVNAEKLKAIPRDSEKAAKETKRHWTKAAKDISESFSKTAEQIAKSFAGAVATVTALSAAVFKLADDAGKHASQLASFSKTIGVTTTELQEYEFVLKRLGRKPEAFYKGMLAFNKFYVDAMQKGTGAVAESVTILGMKLSDISGKRGLDALSAMREEFVKLSEVEQNAVAAKLFEKEYGGELTAVLSLTADEFERLRKEAHKTGNVLSEDLVKSGAESKRQLDVLKGSLTKVKNELGIELLPLVNKLVREFSNWARANKDLIKHELLTRVGQLSRLVQEMAPVIEWVLDNWKVLIGLWAGVKAIAGVLAMSSALATLGVSLGAIQTTMTTMSFLNPFTGMLIGIAAAAAGVAALTLQLQRMDYKKRFGQDQGHGVVTPLTSQQLGALSEQERQEALNEWALISANPNASKIHYTNLSKLKEKANDTLLRQEEFIKRTAGMSPAEVAREMALLFQTGGKGYQDVPLGSTLTAEAANAEMLRKTAGDRRLEAERLERARKAEAARRAKDEKEKAKARSEAEAKLAPYLKRAMQLAGLRPEAYATTSGAAIDFYTKGGSQSASLEKAYAKMDELGGFESGAMGRLMALQGNLDEAVNDARAPAIPLMEITKGHAPRVIVSNVYNTFNFDNDFSINGATDPKKTGEMIVHEFNTRWSEDVERVTNTVKPIFAR